eukprot:6236516-Ditylum_brightwellii.AAC.1
MYTLQQMALSHRKEAVLTTKKSMPPGITSHLCPDFDVITKLQSELQHTPNLIISWVKAHQDKKKPFHNLPLDAQLNCIADKGAAQFCTSASPELQPTESLIELPQNKAYMIHTKYVQKKTSLLDNVMDTIDWDALGRNLEKQHLFNQIRL